MNSIVKNNYPYFILLLVVILGYWQISFLYYGLKWDFIDVVFPFRFYFSESIQSGYFPFWNPYLQTGTPFFADLQVPTFYPELIVTSVFSGYGIYAMHFLFIAYSFVAATGMYKLSFYFNNSPAASLLAGIAYGLSGFFVGHGQHLFLLVGTAWIPFVIVSYLKLNRERRFIDILKTAIFVFLMISGAYQALSFALMYLMLLLFIYFILNEIQQKNRKKIFEIIKVNLILLLIVILFSLPLIVSTLEILTSVDRFENGISLIQTCSNGQNFKSIISFVLPFSTLKYSEFFGGIDQSMLNHYFGLIALLFFMAAMFKKRTKLEYLFLGFGLIIFASSFSFIPVREFMFKYIPLMNLFKYAAFIRVFGLLAFILIGANYFAYFQKNFETERKKLAVLTLVVLSGLFALIAYSAGKVSINDFKEVFGQNSFFEIVEKMSFYQHVLLQAIIQVIVLFVFLLILRFYKNINHPSFWISTVFILEIVVATQLNISFTVGDSESKPYKMKRDLSLFPEKFPIPTDSKIIFNDRNHASFAPFWRNTYNFSKQITFNSFSSFKLKSYSKLADDYPNLKEAVLNNHLFYFSDTIFSIKQFADSCLNPQRSSKYLYFSDSDFKLLSTKNVITNSTDSVAIIEFSPNKVKITTHTQNDQFLTMLQTNFKGWSALIDNKSTPIYTSNFNYRTIFLPKGEHTVLFEYRNKKIVVLYILSNILFFLTLAFLLWNSLRKRNLSNKVSIFTLAILVLITLFFIIKRVAYTDLNLNMCQIYEKQTEMAKQ